MNASDGKKLANIKKKRSNAMTNKQKLIFQLIEEIRKHISNRISSHILNYANYSEADFINSFIIIPESNDLTSSLVLSATKTKQLFEANVTSELIEVTLQSIRLHDNFKFGYVLSALPVFIGNDYEYDSQLIYITGSVLQFPGEGMLDLLETISSDDLNKYIKKVRNATLIDSLKTNA